MEIDQTEKYGEGTGGVQEPSPGKINVNFVKGCCKDCRAQFGVF